MVGGPACPAVWFPGVRCLRVYSTVSSRIFWCSVDRVHGSRQVGTAFAPQACRSLVQHICCFRFRVFRHNNICANSRCNVLVRTWNSSTNVLSWNSSTSVPVLPSKIFQFVSRNTQKQAQPPPPPPKKKRHGTNHLLPPATPTDFLTKSRNWSALLLTSIYEKKRASRQFPMRGTHTAESIKPKRYTRYKKTQKGAQITQLHPVSEYHSRV